MPLPTIFFSTNTGEQSDHANLIRRVRHEINISSFNFQFKTITCTTGNSIDILNQMRAYRNEISFFYFGARTEHFQALVNACYRTQMGSFFDYLTRLRNLDLIFLNSCSQDAFVQPFLGRGIEVLVGTSQQLSTEQATNFAAVFCQQFLLHDATTQAAYQQAIHSISHTSGHQTSQLTGLRGNQQFRLRRRWKFEAEGEPHIIGESATSATTLPPLPATLALPTRPFPGPRPYCSVEAPVFFGRDTDLAQLYRQLTTTMTQPLILLYGQSGVGKTSLLKAGLLPRLEQQYYPYYFDGRATPYLYQALCQQVQPVNRSQITRPDWAAWLANQDRNLLLIVDHLEPQLLSRKPKSQADLISFMQAVAALVTTPISGKKPCVIFSVREENLVRCQEFLAQSHLQSYIDYVSLHALNIHGIRDVLRGFVAPSTITAHYQFAIEGEVAAQIVTDLIQDQGSSIAPFLQAILAKLWKEADYTPDRLRQLSLQRYEEFYSRGRLLHDFLKVCLDKVCRRWPPIVERKALIELLMTYVSASATSSWQTSTTSAATPMVITRLQDSYLLTAKAGEQTRDRYLGHQLLALSIRRHRLLTQKHSWFSRTSNGLFFWIEQILVKLFPQDTKASPSGKYSPQSYTDCDQAEGKINAKGCLRWLVVLIVMGLLLRFYPSTQIGWQQWYSERDPSQQSTLLMTSKSAAISTPSTPPATPSVNNQSLRHGIDLELKRVSRLYAYDALPAAHTNRRSSVLAFSSDAALLFAGGGDNTLEVWSVAGSQGHPSLLLPTDNNAPVTTIHIQGNLLVYTTAAGMVGHVRLDALGYIEPFQRNEAIELLRHQGPVTAVTLSRDGNLLVTGGEDGAVHHYNLQTRQLNPVRTDPADPITAVALHPHQQTIAYASANQMITIWDRATNTVTHQLTGHTGRVNSLEFSPDGVHLLSASSDGAICLWQVVNAVRDYCFVDLTAAANLARYSPDGALIFAARNDGFLWIWDAASYRLLYRRRPPWRYIFPCRARRWQTVGDHWVEQ